MSPQRKPSSFESQTFGAKIKRAADRVNKGQKDMQGAPVSESQDKVLEGLNMIQRGASRFNGFESL